MRLGKERGGGEIQRLGHYLSRLEARNSELNKEKAAFQASSSQAERELRESCKYRISSQVNMLNFARLGCPEGERIKDLGQHNVVIHSHASESVLLAREPRGRADAPPSGGRKL